MSGIHSGRVGIGEILTDLVIEPPETTDGAALWRLAKDSRQLDVNSSYAYLLWCRDFRDTSVVARVGGEVHGFVTGYLRPDDQQTVLVWQVAVDAALRGRGVAGKLLDSLLNRLTERGVRYLETTVTADNAPSNKLFRSLAARWGASCERSELFTVNEFPDGHDSEFLYRIGPLAPIRHTALV
ncbi:MAG TPA: diaminobutyrate acetyltransferase [Pseudonocardiaceae bacterium]|jgi:L-2,4-diaminobutyric acid acetyltransferase|nr:diaminobutyrate acetyltransferase [Pseudonocardiaceae bacterium]